MLLCSSDDAILNDRVNLAIDLFKNKRINKIIICGGIGFFDKKNKIPEAIKAKKILMKNNIKEQDVIIEDKSRTTYENIKYGINLVDDTNDLLLITSNFHIKRSLGVIKKLTDANIEYIGIDSINDKYYIKQEKFLTFMYKILGIPK